MQNHRACLDIDCRVCWAEAQASAQLSGCYDAEAEMKETDEPYNEDGEDYRRLASH
jgi:hypothetical protein